MSALLTRQTEVEIRESNIAVLGRQAFEATHQAKGDSRDPEWEGVGKAGGVKMWRTGQIEVLMFSDRRYFYDEDAYIVLHMYKKADSGRVPFSYDIYYWIGQKATQDDIATAAYKSVELDEREFSKLIIKWTNAVTTNVQTSESRRLNTAKRKVTNLTASSHSFPLSCFSEEASPHNGTTLLFVFPQELSRRSRTALL
ncbi:hypothetical protein OG21DRAFT_1410449 [Imleria badia]|nr:hypothetical protein OG21DRAFT_1410449 [Imleria badia]